MTYEERRKQSYEELKEAKCSLQEELKKSLDKNNLKKKLQDAYYKNDKFLMFDIISELMDQHSDSIARAWFLEYTKDFAYIGENKNWANK